MRKLLCEVYKFKGVCLVAFALICTICGAQAQESKSDKSHYMSFTALTRAGSAITTQGNRFSMIDVEASFGYHFNDRWSLHIPLAASTGLFHSNNSFREQTYLGLSAEYKVVNRDNWNLAIVPKVQSTLGSRWGAMAYDLGLNFQVEKSVIVGLGVRYLDTYKSPAATTIPNKFCVYATIGFRLNSPK